MTDLTPALLAQIMGCGLNRAVECFPAMISAMRAFGITTPADITCFATQVRWESGGLVYFAELASGQAYEGRADLGNTQPGDGPRFKGSGPIQVTGRDNFTAAQRALDAAGTGIDIIANPELARTVQYGFWISCWWWQAHGGNQVAQRSPLSYASLCCGRLVNRGNADSPNQAQNEPERIQAFNHVSGFGTLSLPGMTTPPPLGDDMSAADVAAINAHTDAALAHIKTFIDGNPVKPAGFDRNGAANRAYDTLAAVNRLLTQHEPADYVFFQYGGSIYEAHLPSGAVIGMHNPAELAARKAILAKTGHLVMDWPGGAVTAAQALAFGIGASVAAAT